MRELRPVGGGADSAQNHQSSTGTEFTGTAPPLTLRRCSIAGKATTSRAGRAAAGGRAGGGRRAGGKRPRSASGKATPASSGADLRSLSHRTPQDGDESDDGEVRHRPIMTTLLQSLRHGSVFQTCSAIVLSRGPCEQYFLCSR